MISGGEADYYLIDSYGDYCDNLKNEIIASLNAGIQEGLREGIEDGIKKGIKGGLAECLHLPSFFELKTVNVKEIDEILREVATETLEEQIKYSIQGEICPIIQRNIKDFCDFTLEAMKEREISIDAEDIPRNKIIKQLINAKRKEMEQKIISLFPQNFIFFSLSKGLETAICECVMENLNKCSERILQNSSGNLGD